MSSLLQDLERIGGGIFVTQRGIDSRLSESEIWRAFEEPVVVWVHGESFDDSGLERLIEITQKFPHIRRFRFTSTKVTLEGTRRIHNIWPDISIEGVVA